MAKPHWNRTDVISWDADFGGDKLTVDTNEYSERPVVIEIPARYSSDPDISIWMTPDEARSLAGKLIEFAAAVDRAGPAQGIEAGTAETEGLGAQHESAVGNADAPASTPTPTHPESV